MVDDSSIDESIKANIKRNRSQILTVFILFHINEIKLLYLIHFRKNLIIINHRINPIVSAHRPTKVEPAYY